MRSLHVFGTSALVALALTGCGDSRATTSDAEHAIRRDFPKPGVKVDSVDCIDRGEGAARCIADVSGTEAEGKVSFDVTLGKDRKVIWEVANSDLAPADAATQDSEGTEPASPSSASPAQVSLAAEKARLEVAGFAPEPDEVSDALAALRVDGVGVSLYGSAADAARAAQEVANVYGETGEAHGTVEVRGPRLYSLGKPRGLTAAESAKFRRIVEAAEGDTP